MKRQTKEYCESLAKMYGAKLTWIKNPKRKSPYGYYIPGTNKIHVSRNASNRMIISIFCHELGHFLNLLNKKFYKYHAFKGKDYTRRFKTKRRCAQYALDAELYTDKVGRELCKQYFPSVKYHGSYKNNDAFYNHMYQKYFGQKLIIFLLEK